MVLRRATTWVGIAFLIGVPGALIRADLSGVTSLPADAVSFYLTIAPLAIVVSGLLIGAPLLSPTRRKHLETIWIRGPAAASVALRAWGAGMAVAIVGLIASVALSLGLGQLAVPKASFASAPEIFAIGVPAMALTVTFAMVLGMLAGEILAAAAMFTLTALTAVVLPQSPLFGWTWLGGGTFYDPLLGFGPDAGIVRLRAVACSATAASVALVGAWILGAVDSRSAATRRSATLLALALILPTMPIALFSSEAQARSRIESWPVVEDGASISTRGVDIDIDCSAGTLKGVSSIAVRASTGRVVLGLNSGLRVSQVDPTGVNWVQAASGAIELQGVRDGATVIIRYEGSLRYRRDDYQRALPGIGRIHVIALPVRAYVSPQLCFLIQGGDWYPQALGDRAGSDGSEIGVLTYQVRNQLEMIQPRGAPTSGRLVDPPSCALVAAPSKHMADLPVTWQQTEGQQWQRLRDGLRRLGQFADAEGTWLPLIGGGGGFGVISDVPVSSDGLCLPARGLPTSREPIAARQMAYLAGLVAVSRQIDIRPRAAVRWADGSTQDQGPRALPAVVPGYVGPMAEALADSLDPEFDEILTLRRAAMSSPEAESRLVERGVLPGPPLHAAVLGIHEYRRLSGDDNLSRFLGSLAAEARGSVPTPEQLRAVIERLPPDQTAALEPLVEIR